MDDELLWEVILSYVGNGSKAAPTAKILGAAARSRAARPYFLTALKRGAGPWRCPLDWCAARRIGGFLLRRARERMGKEEEPRPKQEQIPDIKTTVKQLISEIAPAPPHIAVLFASGGWAGRLADLREASGAFAGVDGVARGRGAGRVRCNAVGRGRGRASRRARRRLPRPDPAGRRR